MTVVDVFTIAGAAATIVGVCVALYVAVVQIGNIQRQQDAIAEQVTRRPRLALGFTNPGLGLFRAGPKLTQTVHLKAPHDGNGLRRLQTQISLKNDGGLTASNILLNIWVRKEIEPVTSGFVKLPSDRFSAIAIGPDIIKPINPGDYGHIQIDFLAPLKPKSFTVWTSISLSDQAEQQNKLRVFIGA